MSKFLLFVLFLLLHLSSYAHQRDSFAVYFPLNKSELPSSEQQKIDSLIYNELLYPSGTIAILGYTDYLAGEAYNQKLSEQRAENVRAYLMRSGFNADHIITCIGKGKIERTGQYDNTGNSADRKVIIAYVKKAMAAPKDIKTLKVNETMALKNINFAAGTANILSESIPELQKLYDIMKTTPALKIRIEGHICCDPENINFKLSVDRAKVVYNYLINKGIDTSRLDYKGCGIANPVVKPEITEEDCRKNRRVEIRILGK